MNVEHEQGTVDQLGRIEDEIQATVAWMRQARQSGEPREYKTLTDALKNLCAARSFLTGELSPHSMLPALDQMVQHAEHMSDDPYSSG